MNIIACIVVGIVAGWIAERVTGRNHGLLMNLIVGIVGASIGGFLATSVLGLHFIEGFNVATIAVATAGAILLLMIFGGMRRDRVS
ncbi:MAG: GlsB/YeaQ/YmgE family stress response membrane protein [Hyphomicrobiaceae bacterium]